MLKSLLLIALSAGTLVTLGGCVVAPIPDNYPRQMNDRDRDGVPNRYDRDRDRDRDGDGSLNRNDRRPNSPTRR